MCITTYRDNAHWVKLANWGTAGIWVSYAKGHPTSTYQVFDPRTKTIILTQDVTFLQMLYGEYSKDEITVLVAMSYEGLEDEEEFKMVPIISQNNNNNYNKVSDSDSENNDDNDNENILDEDIDNKNEATH